MSWSTTELQTRACGELVRGQKWFATMLLRSCVLDYEEKNDTGFITITAPRDSYQMLKSFNNPKTMELYITPEKLDSLATRTLFEYELVVRSIYHAFALVFNSMEDTPTALQVRVKEASRITELQPQKPVDMFLEAPANNQCRQFDNNNPVCIWENLRFRSHTEIRIAQALDRRKVLFFPNCAARLGFSHRQNREADFLVCEKGKWGILEVDSPDSHPPSRTVEDHERARLFQAHGILLVQHFDGGECFENADGVVDKFLYLLRNQK